MNIIEKDYNWAHELSARQVTNLIILHHAAAKSCTAADVHNWHLNRGWAGIGYHFFVGKDGSVTRGRPLWAVGAHAESCNWRSVGVCFEGDYQAETEMPAAQLQAVVSWCSISRLSWAWIVWLATATLQWRGRAAPASISRSMRFVRRTTTTLIPRRILSW